MCTGISFGQPLAIVDTSINCMVKVPNKAFDVDAFGNIYLVTANNEVCRFSSNHLLTATLADRKLGTITSIDVTNPLKLLIFVDDFNKVIWVDNNMAVIRTLDLESIYGDITAAATSNDGGMWLFSPVKNIIYKTDTHGNQLFYSNNLMDFGIIGPKVTQIKERDNHLLVSTQNYGLLVFDNFGQFIWKEDSIQQSAYFDGKLFFIKDGHLDVSNLDFIESKPLNTVSAYTISPNTDIRVTESKVYLRKSTCIEVIRY